MKHLKMSMLACVFVTLVLALLLRLGRAEAAPPKCGTWNVVSSPNVGSNSNNLTGVAADSKREVWAVGSYNDSSGVGHTLIEQWDGNNWGVVSSPNPNGNLQAVTLVPHPGPSTLWAAGYYLNSSGGLQTLTVFHC